MKHYGYLMVTVIVIIAGEPAASCRGLFCCIQFKKKIEVSANSGKSSSSSYYHCNHNLFPLLAALLFPIKGIKYRLISKR